MRLHTTRFLEKVECVTDNGVRPLLADRLFLRNPFPIVRLDYWKFCRICRTLANP